MNNKPTRLRTSNTLRKLVRECSISMDDIIYPLFVVEGTGIREEISSMPEQYHLSVDRLKEEVERLKSKGIQSLLLFGEPACKDEKASQGYAADGIVQKAIKEIKRFYPEMLVITDVCLCQYKSDGHCCFFDKHEHIQQTRTLETLSKIALSHAEAGADMIAPSDMMDGRIASIRQILDENGFDHVAIMSYSAKYASNFYGPFRDAVHSAPAFGDRKSYQMDFGNRKEAIKEMQLDLDEGADILMVKPAGVYLDIIKMGSDQFNVPMAAYQVSGEYTMLYQGVKNGVVNEMAIYESLMAIKRSGANLIITYFAKEVQELLGELS